MAYPSALLETEPPATEYSKGVDSAYLLFSHTNMTGRFHILARFIDSWSAPWLEAPSPKNTTLTLSVPFTFAVSATPVATGMLDPTIPLAPSIPFPMSAMCIVPPLPLPVPVDFPNNSAIISFKSTPFAMQ